jgi:hypothetical protein
MFHNQKTVSYTEHRYSEGCIFVVLQPDSLLTWKTHIKTLLHKLSAVCFIMRRLSDILNIDTVGVVYFVYFQMSIKYNISPLSSFTFYSLNPATCVCSLKDTEHVKIHIT